MTPAAAFLALLERTPAPRMPRARLSRRLLGRRTDRGPAPIASRPPGAGPLSRLATWATLPLRLRRATGEHRITVRKAHKDDIWEDRPRVTHRGDTGEIDMRWDPDGPFPMARPYARKAGYR